MVMADNPFKVFTPEDLDTEQMMDLFFEVPYLNSVQDAGNTMLNGPRGSGKSMILRYMKPDCQMRARSASLNELPFFGVLISIKKAVNLTELRRLNDYGARTVLGEHALATYVGSRLFESVMEVGPLSDEISPAVLPIYEEVVQSMLRYGGPKPDADRPQTALALLAKCKSICEDAYSRVNHFAKRLAFSKDVPYEGPLCDYLTFLHPIVTRVLDLPFMPQGRPVFLMFDDADHLGEEQARVLNSWLVARTQGDVNFKVAAQARRTLMTADGRHAKAPHDFQQIDMADIYTTKRGRVYYDSVEGIVHKRLLRAGIDQTPEAFFPPNEKQETAIRRVEAEYRDAWKEEGRGYRASDDVLRYARPEYMTRLAGQSKSSSTFYYAGFKELVHISSGQVRYFLEPAAKMFDDQKARNGQGDVHVIEPSIQSKVLREEANALMFGDFEDLKKSMSGDDGGADIDRLRNLISFLGGVFRHKLVSRKYSERRVFSAAITRGADADVQDVLDLGVDLGYLHPSSLGNKEGTGRVRLYVLTRRLAPYFNLDPSSFAGYEFFPNQLLRRAIDNHVEALALLDEIKRKGFDWVGDDQQRELF